jgi:murein DD-endopeptidase MepM/ murein hydrolase activator NlpD
MRSYPASPYPQYGRPIEPDEWPEDIEEDEFFGLPEEEWGEEELFWEEEDVWDEEVVDDRPLLERPLLQRPLPEMPFVLVVATLFIISVMVGLVQLTNISTLEQIPGTPIAGDIGRGTLFVEDPLTVAAPYERYALTQGLHGQSYGHLAIDLAAGRGEPVISPINGFVTNLYVDEYGNTTLVIENEVYMVTMLHGDYTVAKGDELVIGQVVGTEGNNGYTMDFFGNLCYGLVYCGNHTHLNIYDKRIQANVNPLDLIQ